MGFAKGSTHPTDCVNFDTTGKSRFRLSEIAAFVQPRPKKYFQNICCAAGQITSINHPILTRQEGRYANVSNVGQVAVDVGGFLDEWSSLRTAKPWGPGTPTLVSSLRDAIPASDGG
jgi:hypothetical protein